MKRTLRQSLAVEAVVEQRSTHVELALFVKRVHKGEVTVVLSGEDHQLRAGDVFRILFDVPEWSEEA